MSLVPEEWDDTEEKEQIKKAKGRKRPTNRKKCSDPHSGHECGRVNTDWRGCRKCTWNGPGRPAKLHGPDGKEKTRSLTFGGSCLCIHGSAKMDCKWGCPGPRRARFNNRKFPRSPKVHHPQSDNVLPPPGWVQSTHGLPWSEMSARARSSSHYRHRNPPKSRAMTSSRIVQLPPSKLQRLQPQLAKILKSQPIPKFTM